MYFKQGNLLFYQSIDKSIRIKLCQGTIVKKLKSLKNSNILVTRRRWKYIFFWTDELIVCPLFLLPYDFWHFFPNVYMISFLLFWKQGHWCIYTAINSQYPRSPQCTTIFYSIFTTLYGYTLKDSQVVVHKFTSTFIAHIFSLSFYYVE